MKYFLYSLFLTILFSPAFTYAELPCGNIIVPEELYSQDSPLVTIPVADCSDPFNKTQGVESPYILKIGGAEVHEGEIVEVPVGGTRDYVVEGYPILSLVTHSYYLHDGNDYR